MKKLFICCLLFVACQKDFGNLNRTAKLPSLLDEVSGIQYDASRNAFWMLNDSGNKPSVYLVSEKGNVIKEIKVNSKNRDWEDITQDSEGNVYIGDFGNNSNKRKDLQILKIAKEDLKDKKKVEVVKTFFSFPEQTKFPPNKMYYDVEGFFEYKNFFYVFTKSRVKKKIGRTFLYKIPNKAGVFEAELISDFMTCKKKGCWITGADITPNGKKIVLLNHTSAWVFTDFLGDNFFSGKVKEYKFNYNSQKESITFKNDSLVFIADEKESEFKGRNLYSLKLKSKS